VETGYLIALQFGTQKGGIMAYLGTTFGYNTIITRKVIRDYLRKITPICCHAHRVNHERQEAGNWYRGRLTYRTLNFLWYERNRAKDHEGTAKNPRCVINT